MENGLYNGMHACAFCVILQPFDRSYIDNPGPMVVFATPGMLHGGLSLQIFKKWCVSENNMVVIYLLYLLLYDRIWIKLVFIV